jgi:GntR family transcriptional regulator
LHYLDKGNRIPIYIQIRQIILDEIRAGTLKPDQQILSETHLAQLYGVSRLTARSAVTQLVNEGHLTRVHGQGTFVKRPRIETPASSANDFMQDMRNKGYAVKTELLAGKITSAASSIRDALNLSPRARVYYLRRRRSVNNETLMILESYLPAKLCPDLLARDFEARSLYEILQTDYKLALDQAQERLEAQVADQALAADLHIEKGAAVLFSTRKAVLVGGTPIEFTNCWYRGDRYAFEVALKIGQSPRIAGDAGMKDR